MSNDFEVCKHKWISVKDKFPPKYTNVLCNVKNHKNFNIQLVLTREDKTHDGIDCWLANFIFKSQDEKYEEEFPIIPDEIVTHWMPLPDPPIK